MGRADSLKACNLQQGTLFYATAARVYPVHLLTGFFFGSNLLSVLLWPPRCRSEFFLSGRFVQA